MRRNLWAAAALVTAAVWSVEAHASVVTFNFDGVGVSGLLTLTYEVNPNVGALPGTAPNPVDPVGSYVITGATGSFSDAAQNFSNVAVTGIAALNRVSPEPTNLQAPNSFSLLTVQNGVDNGGQPSLGLHYDNLLYPAGSPPTASDYPFAGGVFDIYGMIFTLSNGDYVNLWSNGVAPEDGIPGLHLNYGVAITDAVDVLDYVTGVTITPVPEPATWAMMLAGFGAAGAVLRRRRTATARAA